MMKRSLVTVIAAVLFACAAPPARAEAEFYGVKMPSESFASGVVLRNDGSPGDAFPSDDGVDRSVYAYARFDGGIGAGAGIEITIVNQTQSPLSTDYLFAEYTVVTNAGDRITLDAPDPVFFPATKQIAPGARASFRPGLGIQRIKKEDVRYIICAFDMGETKIVLLPLPPGQKNADRAADKVKEAPKPAQKQNAVKPAAAAEAAPLPASKASFWQFPKSEKPAPKPEPAPKPSVMSDKQDEDSEDADTEIETEKEPSKPFRWFWQGEAKPAAEKKSSPEPKTVKPAEPKREPARNFNLDQKGTPIAKAPESKPEPKKAEPKPFRWPWQGETSQAAQTATAPKAAAPARPSAVQPKAEPAFSAADSSSSKTNWSEHYWEKPRVSIAEPERKTVPAPAPQPKPEGSEKWTTDWTEHYWEKPKYAPVTAPVEKPKRSYEAAVAEREVTPAAAAEPRPAEAKTSSRWRWPWQSDRPKTEDKDIPAPKPAPVKKSEAPKPAEKKKAPEAKKFSSVPVKKLPLQITGFRAEQTGPHAITLYWQTTHVARCSVRFGVAPKMLISKGSAANPGNDHSVTLGGLRTGVNYYYQIVAVEGKDSVASEVLNVRL